MPIKFNPKISIVIPNWNGVHLMRQHLPHVVAAAAGAEIVVTDDASSDESVAFLQTNFPEVKIVDNKTRQGFAGNVNRGVEAARGDIVVLLNTDVRPQKGFLESLVRHFTDPVVFAVGCLEESHEPEGIVRRGRGVARWEKGFFVHARGRVDKTDTAWVSGGSGAFRRSLWQKLGGMDPLFNPFYWEDIDLCYRALKAGYRLVFEPRSVVGHFHEEGKIKREFTPAQVKRIAYRNQFIFIWKNLSDLKFWLQHILWTPWRLGQAILRGDFLFIAGFIWALARLPRVARRRLQESRYWQKSDRKIFP